MSKLGRQLIGQTIGNIEKYECVICEETFQENVEPSHNAEPVENGRCCGYCNDTKVIPTRLESFFSQINKEED